MKEMKSNMNAGILPLFYGLFVSELKDEKRRQRWFEKWETFARDDLRGLIEVVIAKMKQVGASQLTTVKVVGLYGVGGIGKTTTCKTLCNELSNDFEGRVCHIEFDSTSSNSKELLQKVLIKLTRRS